MACLIRRLRQVAGKGSGDVICIGTSATVRDDSTGFDSGEVTRDFARRLFGIPRDRVELVTEKFKELPAPGPDHYLPPPPVDAEALLEKVLDASRELQLQEAVIDFPGTLLTQRLDRDRNLVPSSGPTVDRPAVVYCLPGQPYFDTTIGIAIWWNGAAWVNSAGALV